MPDSENNKSSVNLVMDKSYPNAAILIVDDEFGICELLTIALSRIFGQVDKAANIDQAEQLRQVNEYDIILLDVNLPGRSGMEWHELFDEMCGTDVIFISGYANLQTTLQALRLGAKDFILKPFSLTQLLSAIDKCIHDRLGNNVRQLPNRASVKSSFNEVIFNRLDEWQLKEVEKSHILRVVDYCKGNKSAAAKILKISRKTLERKFKEWSLK